MIAVGSDADAFSCYPFTDSEWLKADVDIQCGTDEHHKAIALAWVAIVVYPIGLLLVDEADCAQGPADDDFPDPGWLRRQIDHVQRVVVARRTVDVVGLEGVPERLWEAAY